MINDNRKYKLRYQAFAKVQFVVTNFRTKNYLVSYARWLINIDEILSIITRGDAFSYNHD